MVAAPALLEVDLEEPPIAVLLAQHVLVTGQSLALAPALADVEVAPPPMAVLLAQQALAAEPPWQDFAAAAAGTAFSDVELETGDCADAWLKNNNPPTIRPQTIKILEIDFILLYLRFKL